MKRSSRSSSVALGHSLSAVMLLLCEGCSNRTPSTPTIPESITLTANARRDANNGTVIEGHTNLPDGTKLGVEITVKEIRYRAQDFDVFVKTGSFQSVAFSNHGAPIRPGKLHVHVFTLFNQSWQSPRILELVGKGGGNLKLSNVIVSEDPQLIDAEKRLEFSGEFDPSSGKDIPLQQAGDPASHKDSHEATALKPNLLSEQGAIDLVKKSVLVVDGDKSSMTVEDGVAFYLRFPGIRMGSGWSATQSGEGSYEVSLDFINTVGEKEQHEKAVWEVKISTRTVLYRNKNAKNFSWIPK